MFLNFQGPGIVVSLPVPTLIPRVLELTVYLTVMRIKSYLGESNNINNNTSSGNN
jgi:hypothetical protein